MSQTRTQVQALCFYYIQNLTVAKRVLSLSDQDFSGAIKWYYQILNVK